MNIFKRHGKTAEDFFINNHIELNEKIGDSKISDYEGKNIHILKKIKDLFKCRKISEHLLLVKTKPQKRNWIMNKLLDLQYAIYKLDTYGENNWIIREADLKYIWSDIYSKLKPFSSSDINIISHINDIKVYQEIETGLRSNYLPTKIPIDEFYYMKTCDVRLARALISNLSPSPYPEKLNLFWGYYDLVSEIFDDLIDINEDSFNFNCNRLLIKMSSEGNKRTWDEYINYLNYIKFNLCKFSNNLGAKYLVFEDIIEWAIKRIHENELLLESVMKTKEC